MGSSGSSTTSRESSRSRAGSRRTSDADPPNRNPEFDALMTPVGSTTRDPQRIAEMAASTKKYIAAADAQGSHQRVRTLDESAADFQESPEQRPVSERYPIVKFHKDQPAGRQMKVNKHNIIELSEAELHKQRPIRGLKHVSGEPFTLSIMDMTELLQYFEYRIQVKKACWDTLSMSFYNPDVIPVRTKVSVLEAYAIENLEPHNGTGHLKRPLTSPVLREIEASIPHLEKTLSREESQAAFDRFTKFDTNYPYVQSPKKHLLNDILLDERVPRVEDRHSWMMIYLDGVFWTLIDALPPKNRLRQKYCPFVERHGEYTYEPLCQRLNTGETPAFPPGSRPAFVDRQESPDLPPSRLTLTCPRTLVFVRNYYMIYHMISAILAGSESKEPKT